jgi:hypothetical protein
MLSRITRKRQINQTVLALKGVSSMRRTHRLLARLIRWSSLCVCFALLLFCFVVTPLANFGTNATALAQRQSESRKGNAKKRKPAELFEATNFHEPLWSSAYSPISQPNKLGGSLRAPKYSSEAYPRSSWCCLISLTRSSGRARTDRERSRENSGTA